jgi:demethylmenaquinone methyltransferase/2-methoxy-6-polyprenyl-1,4-benzoquinol methylase
VAEAVTATDIIEEPLRIAENRPGVDNVCFRLEDAYHLSDDLGLFDAAFAGLWLSHVPKERIREFFISIHKHLDSGAIVLLIDNSKAQCRALPITEKDEKGNTYQDRVLDDGTTHRVLKNFPTETELNEIIEGIGGNAMFRELEHFWIFQYEAK